jgi:hypothetical protein
MGRPKGSKNKPGHKAGGNQISQKAKLKTQEKQQKNTSQPTDTERRSQTDMFWERVHANKKKQAMQQVQQQQKHGVELHPAKQRQQGQEQEQEEATQKQQAERLQHIFNHPSNKYGVPGYVDSIETMHTSSEESEADDKKFRPSYQPPSGSPIYHYLNEIKEEVMAGKHDNGANWIPPRNDPLKRKNGMPNVDDWYLSKVWIYLWLPLVQYGHLVGCNQHPCAYCGECNTNSNGYYWRPMFYWERIVFVLHRRWLCKNTKCRGCTSEDGTKQKTFASIDPFALSKLPTIVAERFEFMTIASGPGMHESMMYSFAHLATRSVLFGTFVHTINELHAIDYSRQQVSYYDMLWRWKESILNLGVTQQEPLGLYSAYGKAGYHNGMRMSEGMLQKLFNGVFMGDVNEEYMQGSFQRWYDETLAVDDTFKYANKIFVNICRENRVQPYNCSITIMNGQGKIAMSRLKYTKSHDEMRPLLEELREARANAGAPELKRLETDCPTGDKNSLVRCKKSIAKWRRKRLWRLYGLEVRSRTQGSCR